jgi:hypothetical protein
MSENTYGFNGYVYVSPNYDDTSSNQNTFISLAGDTIRILTQKTPASTDPGFPGEMCFGTVPGLIPVTYLFYCVSPNQWLRVPFTEY